MILASACSTGPVQWQPTETLPAGLRSARSIAFDAQGRLVPHAETTAGPSFARPCVASVRVVRSSAGDRYAAWWHVLSDSSADLMVSAALGGGVWSAPKVVDSADIGRVGCRRPPPAIVADGDNVHVAYAMAAREGPGIFATHSMDRGAIYHAPVAVVYGEKPGLAAVAARGNFVVVAYEDPNTRPTRISVAVSRTMAHLFEYRQVVSPSGGAVASPGVATDGARVAVIWSLAADSTVRSVRVGTVP